jgi:hypothetical protein
MPEVGSKRKNEFLRWDGTKKKKSVNQIADSVNIFRISAVSGTDFKKDKSVSFMYRSGADPIRFLTNPIWIKYRVYIKKDVVTGVGADAVTTQTTIGFKNENKFHFSDLLGAASFIKNCELQIDNTPISSDTSSQQNLYQVLQRRLVNSAVQKSLGVNYVEQNEKDLEKASSTQTNTFDFGGETGGIHELLLEVLTA